MKKKNIIKALTIAAVPVSTALSAGIVHAAPGHEIKMPSIVGSAKNVPYGSKFNVLEGINAYDADGTDLTGRITYEGTVDTSVLGKHEVTYSVVNDHGQEFSLKLTHNVVDMDMPTIKQTMLPRFLMSELKNPIDWKNYFTAEDASDKKILESLKMETEMPTKAGEHTAIFSVTDMSGNKAKIETTIEILDDIAPELEVKDITVEKGEELNLKSAIVKAVDNNDGDVSDTVRFEHANIDTNMAGKHQVKAIAVDKAKNETVKIFNLDVVENLAPKIEGPATVTIKEGDNFDVSKTLKVTDPEGEVLQANLIEGELKNNEIGEYLLKYQATDSKGNTSNIHEITVKVVAKYANIHYNTYGGDDIQPTKVETGSKLGAISLPLPKNGNKTFLGWYMDAEYKTSVDVEKVVEEDMTLHAKWEENVVLTFLAEGHAAQVIEATNAKAPGKMPTEPSKEGFTFKGWFNGDTKYDPEKVYEKDMVFKAVFEVIPAKVYNVTFDAKDGTQPVVIEREEGKMIEYTPGTPKREGFEFLGWFIGDKAYDPSTIVEGSIVVEGRWKELPPPVKYVTIKFNPNNGENVIEHTIKAGETLGEIIAEPRLDGHTFEGWFNADGTRFSSNLVFQEGDTFTAKWKKNENPNPDPEPNPEPEPEPKVEVELTSFNIKNIVGFTTKVVGNGGLFEGKVKIGDEITELNGGNFIGLGFNVAFPEGVTINNDGTVSFNKAGEYVFVLSGKGKSVTAKVIIAEPAKDPEVVITVKPARQSMLAGQSFRPMAFVTSTNGSSDDKITYVIKDKNGNPVDVDLNAMPHGEYIVTYFLGNSSDSLELVVINPPANNEGGRPTLLAKDRFISYLGHKLNFKELVTAADIEGNSLTDKVEVIGEIDWDKVGKYEVTFRVTDSEGRTTDKTVVVEVLTKEEYDAEIAREKAEGTKIETSDASVIASSIAGTQFAMLGSAAAGLVLVIKKRKRQ